MRPGDVVTRSPPSPCDVGQTASVLIIRLGASSDHLPGLRACLHTGGLMLDAFDRLVDHLFSKMKKKQGAKLASHFGPGWLECADRKSFWPTQAPS